MTRECGEWVNQQIEVPGKMVCVKRVLGSVPARLHLQASVVPPDGGRERRLHGL